jgi:Carboxypeptidase regulatory-like domain
MYTSRIAVWFSRTAAVLFISGLACAQSAGTPNALQGVVQDASGSAIAGAIVTLEPSVSASPDPAGQRTAVTDQSGGFHFAPVEPGTYKVAIAAPGFALWTAPKVIVGSGDRQPAISAVLEVAAVSSSVNVTLPQHELAEDQLKAEEKQRLLGVFPNFFVSYAPNAAPLTAPQKLQLGWKTVTDPVTFLDTGLTAGIQQFRKEFPEFGQGTEGYAKRFGALYANRVSSVVIGHVVMQSIFHQDPRYFYKGTGSFGSRAFYAISRAFIRKGDNGHWQPDYSDVLGGLASSELSTLYYPSSSRPVRRLGDDVLLGFAGRAAGNLLREFVLRRITTHVPKTALGSSQRILPEGTPVSLISVDDWSSKTAQDAGPVAFMLAGDIEVDGVIVAPLGVTAWGRASFAGAPGGDGKAMQVGLDQVRLKVGDIDVPLRSAALKDGSAALEYRRIENSGRIAIVLYVAQNVTLPPAR